MSGKIITALSQGAPFALLVKYVIWALAPILFFDIITRYCNRETLLMLNSNYYKHEAILARKALSLDYAKAGSPYVLGLRARITQASDSGGNGIRHIGFLASFVCANLLFVVTALIMVSGMFTAKSDRALTGLSAAVDSPILSVVFAVVCVLLIIFVVKADKKSEKELFNAYEVYKKIDPLIDHYMQKTLNEDKSGKDIRIFGHRPLIAKELTERAVLPCRDAARRMFSVRARYGSVSVAVTAFLGGAVYLYVGLRALSGAFGAGSVVMYYGAVTMLISAVSDAAQDITYLRSNNAYVKTELEYLDMTSDMKYGSRTVSAGDLKSPCLELHDVSFRYSDNGPFVLRHVDLKIEPGKKLAVVGMNGSGKSTLIKLLCRLYDPTEGNITLNGADIREFACLEYYKLFSVVFQDFKLLAFPIGDNVAASDEYDRDRVWQCLDMAGIKERVEQLPKGLDTPLYKLYDKDGIDPSAGEEQKIAIARALYKDAPFVILDEPTASLDPIAESGIYERFNSMALGRTTVFVSHRLSSCRFCDRIVVFDGGRLVQDGTHESLLADSGGRYALLWSAQAQYYADTTAQNE